MISEEKMPENEFIKKKKVDAEKEEQNKVQ